MFGTLAAFALAQAAAPAEPVPVQHHQDWEVQGNSEGCVAHAAYHGGTVLTVFAAPGHEGIGFILQNIEWAGLEHGVIYPLEIRFGRGGPWAVPAIARADIDEDGPGLVFVMPPGADENGRDFMLDFASAADMRVSSSGLPVDSLALSGSHRATVELARCLTRLIDGSGSLYSGAEGEGEALEI